MLKFLRNQRGDIKTGVMIIGTAAVSVLVIAGAMGYVPDFAENFFNDFTGWMSNKFGF
ncbi:MAG: hypothetical protein K9L17_08330 [Clostridiales bacterium]|nr:hypothetical protein [Clostridiales bacterium]MCF8022682.1 hypothetical protein [Clostridiales bacterium]